MREEDLPRSAKVHDLVLKALLVFFDHLGEYLQVLLSLPRDIPLLLVFEVDER